MTPKEAWSGRRPRVDHFKIFGCILYAHIPDENRKKLDDKGEKCVFLGVCDHSKAYKRYNPSTKKVIANRVTVFDEEHFWYWDNNATRQQIPIDFDGEIGDKEQQPLENEKQPTPTPTQEKERPQRIKRKPAWMPDYEVTGVDQFGDPFTHFALFSDCDPTTFEVAIKE